MIDSSTKKALHLATRAQHLKSLGVEVRSADLEREVASDLQLLDRARAEGALGGGKKRKKEQRRNYTTDPAVARPELHAEALARKAGGEFFARPTSGGNHRAHASFLKKALRGLNGVDAERLVAMEKRISLLSERGPGRLKADQTMEQGPWLYPSFVMRIVTTTIAFSQKLGGYRGLTYVDRRRRFFRALEDLCNQSNAAVGFGWWVKR